MNLITARNPAKKRRTAKQRAASKRNIKKAQAARRGGRTRTRRRKRNPGPGGTRVARRRATNPRRPTLKGIIDNQVMPAIVGGTGAVLDDILVNLIPMIPAEFKTGPMRHATKAVGAILIGYVSAMFLPRKIANQLGAGAMTVVGYNVVREVAARFAPQLPLGEYLDPLGEYLDPALGWYGAGLDPTGGGLEVGHQFTRGTPYIDPGDNELSMWPTGGDYDEYGD